MEFIYIAKSDQHPGIVKIGRTDREVSQRMQELSRDDYGPSDWKGDSEWEAHKIFKVDNNEISEKILHDHFSHLRVDPRRELFATNDIDNLSVEAQEVVKGTDILDIFDSFEALSSALGIVSIASGLVITLGIFSKSNFVKQAEEYMKNWENRLELRYQFANSIPKKVFYGVLKWSHGTSKIIGGFYPSFAKDLISSIKQDLKKKNKRKEIKLKKNLNSEKLIMKCAFGHVAVKRKNSNTGEFFWGCSKYPDCKWTKNIN